MEPNDGPIRRRVIGFAVLAALLGGAILVGLGVEPTGEHEWVLLDENGGSPIGTLSLRAGKELCWDIELRQLPKALQLHYNPDELSDPIALSFYEPPNSPRHEGCKVLSAEFAALLTRDPTDFYMDGHESEDEAVPALMAELSKP